MGDTYLDDLMPALDRLDRLLHRAVERMVAIQGDDARSDPFRGLYISQTDAMRLLEPTGAGWDIAGAEERPILESIDAASALAELARTHGLSGFDLEIVLIALAPELDLR